MNFNKRKDFSLAFFIFPAVAVIVIVAAYPLLMTIFSSLTNMTTSGDNWDFIFFDNYKKIFSDSAFRQSILTTLIFTFVTVPIELIIGIATALLINKKFVGKSFVVAILIVPWTIPTVVSSQIWKWMYHDVFGVINAILMNFKVIDAPVAWISSGSTALASVMVVDIWKTFPFMTIIVLGALSTINKTLYESADIDGANSINKFFSITLPLITPAILVGVLFRTLDAIRVFDLVYVITQGAYSTETIATYNRRVLIEFQKLGEGSAISTVLFLISFMAAFAISILINRKRV